MTRCVVLLLFLFIAAPVSAADSIPAYQPPTVDPAPVTAAIVQRLIAITTIGLAICVGIYYFARQQSRTPPPDGAASHQIRLLNSIAIASGETIFLIQAGTLQLAVGAGKRGIESISLVNDSFSNVLASVENAETT